MTVASAAYKPGVVLDGRYRLLKELATTRFSRVYRGVQLSTGQSVAIKVLELDRIPTEARLAFERRFRREMAIYSEVRHPNLVRLLDTGTSGESLYLVLEFVDGLPLSRVLRDEGQLGPFESRRLMGQCLDALSAGHARDIVHRDFKPDNVMITSTGSERNAVVLDFGLAGLREGGEVFFGDTRRPITLPGTVPGTPSYMAPEQIHGRVLPQTDIYAWGLVYFECLTGRRAVPEAANKMQTLLRQLNDPLELPAWLEGHPLGALLQRATAKSLEDRFASAAEALEALRACPLGGLDAERQEDPLDFIEPEDDDEDDGAVDRTSSVEVSAVSLDAISGDSLITLPSMLISELPPIVQEAEPTTDDPLELQTLYSAYLAVAHALGVAVEHPANTFVERLAAQGEALRRSQPGARAVTWRIVVERHDGAFRVSLQPVVMRDA